MTNTSHNFTVAINTAVGTTQKITYSDAAGGTIHIPNGSSITSLTWHSCPNDYDDLGTYEPAMHSVDEHVTPITYVATVQTVAADGAYPIPAELVGSRYLKAVGDAAGDVYICLKSS